jgi:hypothetical protein
MDTATHSRIRNQQNSNPNPRVKTRVVCVYLFGKGESVTALAEACYRFTPQIALRQVGVVAKNNNNNDYNDTAIFLEIGGCGRLYSEQLLQMKLTTLAKRFGWLSRIAFGDSPGEAFALARNPNYFYLEDLPLEALADYLTPFGGENLEDAQKDMIKTIQILKTLGLKNVGEFATLPPRTLASRFGKEAVELSARVRNQLEMPWPGFHPSSMITEKASVENSENLEALGFVIKNLVDRVVARLHGRCEKVSAIQLDLELLKWGRSSKENSTASRREFKIELPIAQGSVRGLFPILHEHLSAALQRAPLLTPVDCVELKVLESVPSRGAQRDFFSRKEEESELWDALVARLCLKIGAEKVFTALPVKRYLPEKSYRRSIRKLSAENYLSAAWPHRPTRILKHPKKLSSDEREASDWTILDGPERLCGEWWNSHSHSNEEGFFRDYYHVRTIHGEELWVFINRQSIEPVFYLHGYFD